ncbi:MAG: DUF3822 family protein [Bacteroidota bacterium]
MKQENFENIQSIGLLVGPDFFHINCYSDLDGESYVGTIDGLTQPTNIPELSRANPLYSFSVHPNWTLIPSDIFREEDSPVYLKLNTGFIEGSAHGHDEVSGLAMTLVYEREHDLEEKSYQLKPSLQISHLAKSLISKIKRSSKGTDSLNIYLFDNVAYVFIWKSDSLLLGNSLMFETAEDLLYYIMYTLKQLEVSTNIQTDLVGAGKYVKPVKDELKKYLANLSEKEPSEADLAVILSECA